MSTFITILLLYIYYLLRLLFLLFLTLYVARLKIVYFVYNLIKKSTQKNNVKNKFLNDTDYSKISTSSTKRTKKKNDFLRSNSRSNTSSNNISKQSSVLKDASVKVNYVFQMASLKRLNGAN